MPWNAANKAYEAYIEWGKYMKELFAAKKSMVLAGEEAKEMDLMTAIVKGANVTSDPTTQTLTDQDIFGNMFVFSLAGHETSANSLHFSLILLALNIGPQRHFQQDLDNILGGRPVEEWDYERDFPKLFNGMAGATMNEELRILAAVVGIPKCTLPGCPQTLSIKGKSSTIPGNTYIELMSHAAHTNPNQWPTNSPKDLNRPAHPISNRDNDLEEFKPERWFLDTEEKRNAASKIYAKFSSMSKKAESLAEAEITTTPAIASPETASNLYKPPRGAYFPFSEGFRTCIGRKFAQVEVICTLAVIFSRYSVELAVDHWATDGEITGMNGQQKRDVWSKARDQAEKQLREDCASIITLELRRGHIPLRFVERGKERFDFE